MNLLILGANSDVAHAVARTFAKEQKANLFLASRDMEILQKRTRDITTRYGVQAETIYFDATDYDSHRAFYDSLNPKPDGVVVAFGYLGDQKHAQADFLEARKIIEINYLGAVSIVEVIAADFEKRGHGFIIGISSAAGERGRRSNYIYGSAKAGLTSYLSGLRQRMFRSNVTVITVVPGFIDTKMTDHLSMPKALTSSPDQAAADIYRAFSNKKNVVYTRWFWRWIMLVIKCIPEFVFKRISI